MLKTVEEELETVLLQKESVIASLLVQLQQSSLQIQEFEDQLRQHNAANGYQASN